MGLLEASADFEEDSPVAAYCADILEYADRRRIPAAFAAISPQIALCDNPLEEIPWEPDTVKVFGQEYDARRFGNVLVYEVHSGASGELKMPFYGLAIDIDGLIGRMKDPDDNSWFVSKIQSEVNPGYLMAWQAAYEGLTRDTIADGLLERIWQQSIKKNRVKMLEDTDNRWDVTQVRKAWEMHLQFFEQIIDLIARERLDVFTIEELSVLAAASAWFFVRNTGMTPVRPYRQLSAAYHVAKRDTEDERKYP